MTNLRAKFPIEGNWIEIDPNKPTQDGLLAWHRFLSPMGLRVISAIELVDDKPEFHISMTDNGERIPASLVDVILRQFDAVGFNEDNHLSGKARHFWKPITSDKPDICPCQDNEKPTVEGDYTWRE